MAKPAMIRESAEYTSIDGLDIKFKRVGGRARLSASLNGQVLAEVEMTVGPDLAKVPNLPYERLEEMAVNVYKGFANGAAHDRGEPRPFPYKPGERDLPREGRAKRRRR